MSVLDSLKNVYFELEDKYYAFLDKLQTKLPVYSVVDPVDKILPSFGILLALVVAILGFGLFSALAGVGGGFETVVEFNDTQGNPLEGVQVSFERDGKLIETLFTKEDGSATTSVGAGTYFITASKEGYVELVEEVEINSAFTRIFTLSSATPETTQRALLIQDAQQGIVGMLSPVAISLAFSCQSGTPPSNQTVYNGNVSFLQPGDCTGLSVTISANGFLTKTQSILGDTTIVVLQSTAAFEPPPETEQPDAGSVEIIAVETGGAPLEQAQIKLYKIPSVGSNILADQGLSDPNGLSTFSNVTPGKHIVIVSKAGYKQTQSAEFQVNAGEKATLNVEVAKSSSKRKVFVKILSSANQIIVLGSSVSLFVQTAGGKYIEYESFTSDTNGIVSAPLADFNGNTQLVVTHGDFVTKILLNTGIVSEDAVSPIPILLDPLAAPGSNGSSSNAVVADVKVIDEVGLSVVNATVHLYTPDANGVLVGTLQTNTLGIARFTNLPAGTYQATASTSVGDGASPKIQGDLGKIIVLPVSLSLGNALVQVTVKDELGKVVTDANVFIYSFVENTLQSASKTNAQGLAQLGVITGQKVYVKVEKATYLPFSSVPFDVIKDNTHIIQLEVSLTSASQGVDVSLTSIYELSATQGPILAQALVPGNTYAFHFAVKTPVQQTGMKAVVRVNKDSPAAQGATDVGSIVGGSTAKGGVAFYTTYNSNDEFSPLIPADSGVPSKVALNTLGDVNGASSFEYIVNVKINPAALPNTDKLDVKFQSKGGTQVSPLYFESFTIGAPLPGQGDFSFVFFVSTQGGTKTQVSSSVPLVMFAQQDYVLDYVITNTSGSNFPSATMLLTTNTPASFTAAPNQVSLPGFNNSSSVSGSITIKSTQECSSSQTQCSTLTANLSGVGTGNSPTNYPLSIFTSPEKQLAMNITPSYLIPAQTQLVQVVVTDQLSNLAGTSKGVQVEGQLENSSGAPLGSSILFTESTNALFFASIPAASEVSQLRVTASAAGYVSDVVVLPVSNQILLNYSQDFSCVSLNPNPLSFNLGASGSLSVQTISCPEDIDLYTTGFSENSTVIQLAVKNGSNTITSSNPLSLNESESKTLSVQSPSYFGQYPLYVYAKYKSQSTYSLVKNVDVIVNPLAGSSTCLNLSKYAFDVKDGSDNATVVNNCNPGVHDAFLPRAVVNVNGVYGHAIPPVLTPEMQNPGSLVPFSYRVSMDYDNSTNLDVNHDDFPQFFTASNWNRYAITNPAKFFTLKSEFAGVTPVLINDDHYNGSDFILESPNDPQTPWAAPASVRSVLFETTFVTRNEVTLDELCFTSTNIDAILVRIDGVDVQTAHSPKCAIPNYLFSPGPHAIQIFMYAVEGQNYTLTVKYKDAPATTVGSNTGGYAPLSDGKNKGFFVSPLYGILYSNDTKKNGPLLHGPFSNGVIPSTNSVTPKYIDNVGGNIQSIIRNKAGGMEHLKQSYLHISSTNPSVRTFMHHTDAYAQYVGFDDATGQQDIVFENLGMEGEKYGLLTLTDYSLPTSASGKTLDVGILLDSSPSIILNENDETSSSSGTVYQEGLCKTLIDIKRGLEYYSNATINMQVALMHDVSDTYHASSNQAQNLPCLAQFPNITELFPGQFPGYTEGTHNLDEAWAWGAQKFASHAFWKNSTKLMIVVTDNKPTGLGNGKLTTDWQGSIEELHVNNAATELNNRGIRGVVLYKYPLESSSEANHPAGSDTKQDAVEMYELFAQQTNGFTEALDFSELINNNNPHSFDQAEYNKVAIRLLQHAFPTKQETIVVKLVSHPLDACIGENGEVGVTGSSALPKVSYNWQWGSTQQNMCDFKTNDPTNFRYCDATQFMITLTQKLFALEQAYAPGATPAQQAQIPSLTSFDVYVMRDALNDDFRNDFVEFFVNSSFTDAPAYFKSALGGAWKDYVNPAFNKLTFEIDGNPTNSIVSAGLYRAQIQVTWESDVGTFFVASSPSAQITVKLTKLGDASGLSGYSEFLELPLDGLIGLDDSSLTFHRNGYGTAFTGQTLDLVPTPGLTLRTYPSQPGQTALNTVNVPALPAFKELNTQNRGELVSFNKSSGTLSLRPSVPAPVLGKWSSNSSGQGHLYYGISETSSQGGQSYVSHSTDTGTPLSKWVPIASDLTQSTFGCTTPNCDICLDAGGNAFVSSLKFDLNPGTGACGLRPPLTKNTAFGFTSTGSVSNESYLSTVFYRVPGNDYSIILGCNDSSSQQIGAIATHSSVISNGGASVAGLDLGSSSLEDQLDNAVSLYGMLNLMESNYTCINNTAGTSRVYWNAPRLREDLANAKPSFGHIGNSCVATGNPLGAAGTFTLLSKNGIISQSQTTLGMCPLYNNNNAQNGYYAKLGVPFPVGTQIRFLGSGAITDDPLNGVVQYRSNATNCTQLTSLNCPGPGTPFDFCSANTERYWSGTPAINP